MATNAIDKGMPIEQVQRLLGHLDSFQGKYQDFVKDNLLPAGENRKYEVKYYATVEEIVEKSSARIGAFNKFYI
jgi:hypothetical protein